MAVIIGGRDTQQPLIATVISVNEALYNVVNTESTQAFSDVENRGSIQFHPGDKVLVLFDEDETPYINDIGTVTSGYNFVEIASITPLDGLVVIPDQESLLTIVRTNSERVLVRGTTLRNITGNPLPVVEVNGSVVPADCMSVRTENGQSTSYVDFQFEYSLEQGDIVYELQVTSFNGVAQAQDSISLVKNTTGPTIQSATYSYPGSQTAVKHGDIMSFVVHTDLETATVTLRSIAFQSPVFLARTDTINRQAIWIGTAQIADIANASCAFTIDAADDLGNLTTRSNQQLNTPHLLIDQTAPSLHIIGVTYPDGQLALKGSEQCSIEHVVTDFDTVTYVSDGVQIVNPNVYEASKAIGTISNVSDGDATVTITAHRNCNASETSATATVAVDNTIPAVIAISIHPHGDRSTTTSIVGVGTHQVVFTTNTPLKQAPSVSIEQGDVRNIRGQNQRWEGDLAIPAGTGGEDHFHDFALVGCSNIVGGAALTNTTFRVLAALPIITQVTVATTQGAVIADGATVTVTVVIDAKGQYTNSDVTAVFNATALGGPEELVLNTLIGRDTIQGTFVAEITADQSGVIGSVSVTDIAGNTATHLSAPVDVWAISQNYFDDRLRRIRGINCTGWLQLLNQPSYFTTVAFHDASTPDIVGVNTTNHADAVVAQGTIQVPSDATAHTTYTCIATPLTLAVVLTKDPLIYVDGWKPDEQAVYPDIADLSSYSLSIFEPTITVYVNGDGSNTWAIVHEYSLDAPPYRLRTQISLQDINLFLGNAGIQDRIFFRFDLQTNSVGKGPRVANFGVCYYGIDY